MPSGQKEVLIEPVKISLFNVQGVLTGTVGVLVLVAGAVFFALLRFRDRFDALPFPADYRYPVLVTIMLLAMMAVEAIIYKVHRRNFNFSKAKALTPAARNRILQKFLALAGSLTFAVFLYWLFKEYHFPAFKVFTQLPLFDQVALKALDDQTWYAPYFLLFAILLPLLLLLSIPYFFLCERFGTWQPEYDELLNAYAGFSSLLHLRRPDPHFYNILKSMAVKFFFIPLMVTFFTHSASYFEVKIAELAAAWSATTTPMDIFDASYRCAYEGIYYVDLALALIGYIFSNRLFDTHVRSAEPTLFGWFITIACYRPFNNLSDSYLSYGSGGPWDVVVGGYPVLYVITGIAILSLIFIYVWSTTMFGLRFSNLTNRGIFCRGPYAIIRHPAYVAKNLSWWLIAMPFMSSLGDCLRLLCWNLIYGLRAITEEQHLMNDPHYREYMKKVRYRFIPGLF